ncbi:MAG: hypothetical protein GXY83_28105 [Rhodopirellula sp.]|nr:hypothetical protein [Rhodopirellula sp.]
MLIVELLMFATEKIALAPEWRHRLVNFCQYLTQAATKVQHCCVVAEESKRAGPSLPLASLMPIFTNSLRNGSGPNHLVNGRVTAKKTDLPPAGTRKL